MATALLSFGFPPFAVTPPTPDSQRLLRVASAYLAEHAPTPLLGACVCSCVAWGVAGPTSDLDLQLVVPDGTPVRREKRIFGADYVDHFEWTESELAQTLEALSADPSSQHVTSYSLAFSLIVSDATGLLAQAHALVPAIRSADGTAQWTGRIIADAEQHIAAYTSTENAAQAYAHAWSAVEALAHAPLHHVPGGHCGQWPDRLRQDATGDRAWLIRDAETILLPRGVSLSSLADCSAALERLHADSGTPPHGPGLCSSTVNAAYFAHKARHFLAAGDALAAWSVLDRQLAYVRGNLAAKEAAATPAHPTSRSSCTKSRHRSRVPGHETRTQAPPTPTASAHSSRTWRGTPTRSGTPHRSLQALIRTLDLLGGLPYNGVTSLPRNGRVLS